jgi:hypothetical protein
MGCGMKKYFTGNRIDRANIILALVIISELFLKLFLLLRNRIGWDEFYFLSKVHSFQRGELTQPFQTFHVHLLGWVPWISTNEVIQIIAARCFLFLLFLASGILLYLIARNFFDRTAALFAVFCWLSLSNVIQHGSSLRADSFCSFFFLLACFALLREGRTRSWAAVAGIAMGLSLMVSIKAAIHVVSLLALLGAAWMISAEKKPVFRKAAAFLSVMVLTFGLGFLIHRGTLPLPDAAMQQTFVRHASSKTIVFKEFFPRWAYFAGTFANNFFIWLLLVVGVCITILELIRKRNKKGLIALSFLVPLLSLPFYRNAFPYYYFFIISPAILFCSVLPRRILQDFRRTGSGTLLFCLSLIFLTIAGSAAFHFINAFRHDNDSQAELIGVIHKMFPEPVPYIDGCAAVASYPNAGFFMSTWGFENYLAAGQPIFRRILQEKRPQFMLANTPHLDFRFPRDHLFFKINHDFMDEDKKILRENFIKYWGMLWLPGKTLQFGKTGEQQIFDILIPGIYAIEGKNHVIIDGKLNSPGETFFLAAGKHSAQPVKNGRKIILRWGEVSHIPTNPPPSISTFYGF